MINNNSEVTLPEFYDSKVEEKKTLQFWESQKIFQKVRTARCGEKNLTFYSGPVFPTGYPHSGHFLNSVVKDVFTRYGHKRNLNVESRFGWDCHGVALEHEVDKKLHIKLPRDVESMGITKYNEECRDLVEKHTADWRNALERMGNWVDFDSEYRTMSTEYMERVWKVFKQLYEKGLVYNATKVMPYSTGCFTHLSNFEAEQNMKEVTETGYTIVVSIMDSSEKLLIWTTSPSSLASNVALCVNPKLVYVKVKVVNEQDEELVYILSKNSLSFVFPQKSEYTVLEQFCGTTLKDLKYEPLFGESNPRREWEVLMEDSVEDNTGSGIVPLDEVVLESLKQRGLIFKVEEVTYKKPFCWRSNTPLLHKRVNSWHIRVESIIEDLLKNCSDVNWCWGDKSKEMEFRTWLEEKSRDWTIGRTRYWGTPVPIWSSPSGEEVVCVGSIEELEKLAGKTNIKNIHREVVDGIKIPSKTPGNPPLRRVSEVFDCWFESGAVPFVLNEGNLENLTVDLVAEGSDQTRGWFYTMLILSTALSQPAPFRNVISTGLVLNPDGSKVSKRKYNHNEPMKLIEKYGADTLRLYLLSSPLTEGKNMEIREVDVAHISEVLVKRLWRIFKYCTRHLPNKVWVEHEMVPRYFGLFNIMTGWLCSYTERLLKFYCEEMDEYRVHNIIPRIIDFLQQIEDWFIPFQKPDPNSQFMIILFNVLFRLCLMMAPFAPFITEYVYQTHRDPTDESCLLQSIHEMPFPSPIDRYINVDLEVRFSRMQAAVCLVRTLRARHIILQRYKISELIVVHHNKDYRNDIMGARDYLLDINNAKKVRVSIYHHEFGATLGAKLRKGSELIQDQRVARAIEELAVGEVEKLLIDGQTKLLDRMISLEDIQISYQIEDEVDPNYAVAAENDLLVAIRMNKDLFYYEGGALKEFVNYVKILKRKGNYYPNDKVDVFFSTEDECLSHLISKHRKQMRALSMADLKHGDCDMKVCPKEGRIEEIADIKGNSIKLHLHTKLDCD